MVEGKWFVQGSDLTQPLCLREAVFNRCRDAVDDGAQQVVVYREGIPVGAARLWWSEGAFRVGDIGVLAAERGNGYGDLLVRLLLYKAVTHHARSVTLACPRALTTFFARYGFQPVSNGDPVEMCVREAEINLGCGHGEPG